MQLVIRDGQNPQDALGADLIATKFQKRHFVRSFMVAIVGAAAVFGSGCVLPRDTGPMAETPTCVGEKDCEVKWAAARRWVLDHSATKIQTYSADYLQTYNPPNTADVSMDVSKEPAGADSYAIKARMGCSNPFGCIPSAYEMLNSFNQTVAAAQ